VTLRGATAQRAAGPWHRIAAARELVLHLAARQLRSTHRRTALGWSWPLLVQLVQLAVLVFVFQHVVPLDIANYPAFVFSGLVFWSWFRGGIVGAATSVTDNPALVLEPRTPRVVLPLVAIAVATFDLIVALPVLLVLVGFATGVHASWAFLPVLCVVQLVLVAGLGLLVSAAHVYVRDVASIVGVALLVLFYVTPVFYPLDAVPAQSQWVFDLNPAAVLVDLYRGVLLDGETPPAGRLAALSAASCAVLALGWLVFRRLQAGFADEL
jgi:lipopolysaccharide transport system permease protein